MSKIISIIIISSVISNISFSQSIIYLKSDIGYFLSHSDNKLPITENNDFKFSWGIKTGYIYQLNDDYNLLAEVGYFSAKDNNIMEFTVVDQFGTHKYSFDLSQYSFPLDFSIIKKLNESIGIGIGLSFDGINRTIVMNFPTPINIRKDKINILGVGGNFLFQINYPLNKELTFISDFSIRYIRGIWYSEKGRNLENFNYNFWKSSISVGIGFNL